MNRTTAWVATSHFVMARLRRLDNSETENNSLKRAVNQIDGSMGHKTSSLKRQITNAQGRPVANNLTSNLSLARLSWVRVVHVDRAN